MRCTSTHLETLIAPAVDRPVATLSNNVTDLMGSGHIRKGTRGRYGGKAMTTRCAVNALIGSAVDRPKGMPIGESVDRIREMPLVTSSANAMSCDDQMERMAAAARLIVGLSFSSRCTDFGNAFESIVDDMRSGALDTWAAGDFPWVAIDIVAFSHASIAIDRKVGDQAAVFSFGDWRILTAREGGKVERITRIFGGTLRQIAAALGPIDDRKSH